MDCFKQSSDPAGIRTQDPYIKSVLLYQLSYGIKTKSGIKFRFELIVILSGLEPETYCLEGSCSIQLSYRTRMTITSQIKSGWQDSNLRPPHPKCGAIPGYATPRNKLL